MNTAATLKTPWPRRLFRLVRLSLHLLLGILLTPILLRRDSIPTNPRVLSVIRWWHGRACRILGVRMEVEGEPVSGAALLASTHLSWLDIPVLGALTSGCFLSKSEVRNWPVMGWLAERSGTLFVQRGHRESAVQAAHDIARALESGAKVILFPEGTTTKGQVRRFRYRLFESAIEAGVQVQPVALAFPLGDGTHPLVPFVGEAHFMQHLLGLLAAPRITARVMFLSPLAVNARDAASLARESEAAVRRALGQEANNRQTDTPAEIGSGETAVRAGTELADRRTGG